MILISYDYPTLKQIYFFLIETKGFEHLNNTTQCIHFFEELNDSKQADFKVDENQHVIGKFGRLSKVDLNAAPQFTQMENFLKWVFQLLQN